VSIVLPVSDDAAFTSSSTNHVRWYDTLPTAGRHERPPGTDGSVDELMSTVHVVYITLRSRRVTAQC